MDLKNITQEQCEESKTKKRKEELVQLKFIKMECILKLSKD